MKKNILIITISFLVFCLSAKAQQQKDVLKPSALNAMQMMSQEIRINPTDTAMMHEKKLILSPIWLTPDPRAKIYTKEERDSIVKMVEGYREIIKKN